MIYVHQEHFCCVTKNMFGKNRKIGTYISTFVCRLILREADFTEDFSTVVTEVGKAHLLLFAQFVTTGTVPVTSLDPETVSAFQNLGVHLDQMKLETSFQIKKEMCEETPTNNGDTKHELSKTGLPTSFNFAPFPLRFLKFLFGF